VKEIIIEIIEEISDREITLDSIEILTLEIEVMVRMTGIVPSVIILISQEEPSVIDAVNHVQEAAEEILEIAEIVDVETLEEEEAIVEIVEITVEEILEIIGKGMEEEILVKRLLITTGIVQNVKIPTSHLEPNAIDVGSRVQEGPEEILETVEIVGVETMEEAVGANDEIVEEEILIEIVEMVTEGFPIEMRPN
tara:strand:- start:138 stop:722 length:585 start_codon:yes stop_codon:yes gene_type:complete